MYQDWNTHHDWSVKNAIVDLLVRLKENIKGISGNLLSPLWGNKTIGPASQMLLTGVRLHVHLRLRLHHIQRWHRNMHGGCYLRLQLTLLEVLNVTTC